MSKHRSWHDQSEAEPEQDFDPEPEQKTEVTPRLITTSGTTWAQFKQGGLALILNNLITVNAVPTPVATRIRTLIYGALTDLMLVGINERISNYLSGYPIALADITQQAADNAQIFAMWNQAMTEVNTLITANPPTGPSRKMTPIGMPATAGYWTLP